MISLFNRGNNTPQNTVQNAQQPKFKKVNPLVGRFLAEIKPIADSSDTFTRTDDGECSKESFEKAARLVASTVQDEDNPRESHAFVYKNRIVSTDIGTECSVSYDTFLFDSPNMKVTALHSHPNRSPASFEDYRNFIENPAVVTSCVISPDCEYYKLKKSGQKPDKETIDRAEQEFNEMINIAVEKRRKKINKTIKAITDKTQKCIDVKMGYYFGNEDKNERLNRLEAEIAKLEEKLEDLEGDNYIARKLHKFWLEHAQELGIEIETNFSNLEKGENN